MYVPPTTHAAQMYTLIFEKEGGREGTLLWDMLQKKLPGERESVSKFMDEGSGDRSDDVICPSTTELGWQQRIQNCLL